MIPFNKFWRNTKTEKHRPDPDPLNTDPPPPTPPADRKCICEFCGCQLTPRGEIIRMGDVAKSVRKHDEAMEAKDKEIRRLETALSDSRKEVETLKGSGSGRSSGHSPGRRIQ